MLKLIVSWIRRRRLLHHHWCYIRKLMSQCSGQVVEVVILIVAQKQSIPCFIVSQKQSILCSAVSGHVVRNSDHLRSEISSGWFCKACRLVDWTCNKVLSCCYVTENGWWSWESRGLWLWVVLVGLRNRRIKPRLWDWSLRRYWIRLLKYSTYRPSILQN